MRPNYLLGCLFLTAFFLFSSFSNQSILNPKTTADNEEITILTVTSISGETEFFQIGISGLSREEGHVGFFKEENLSTPFTKILTGEDLTIVIDSESSDIIEAKIEQQTAKDRQFLYSASDDSRITVLTKKGNKFGAWGMD